MEIKPITTETPENTELKFTFSLNFHEFFDDIKFLITPYKVIKSDKAKQVLYLTYLKGEWQLITYVFNCAIFKPIKSGISTYVPESDFLIPLDILQLEKVLSFYTKEESQKISTINTVSLDFDFKVKEKSHFLRSITLNVSQSDCDRADNINVQKHSLTVLSVDASDILLTLGIFNFDKDYTTYDCADIQHDFKLLLPVLKDANMGSVEDSLLFSDNIVFAKPKQLGVFLYSPKCAFLNELTITNSIGSILYQLLKDDSFAFYKEVDERAANSLNPNLCSYLLYFKYKDYQMVFMHIKNTVGLMNNRTLFLDELNSYEALPKNKFICSTISLERALDALDLIRSAGHSNDNISLKFSFNFSKDLSNFTVSNYDTKFTKPCAFYDGDTSANDQVDILMNVDILKKALLEKNADSVVVCYEKLANGRYKLCITTPEYLSKLKNPEAEVKEPDYLTDWVTVSTKLSPSTELKEGYR